LVPKKLGEKLNEKQMEIRKSKFLNQLRIPGFYEVGGLGAYTFISKADLKDKRKKQKKASQER
jgi:hypothetical protein